jgi:WhiB family redox-sensing transcriptional regulator
MARPNWGWQDGAACRGEDLAMFFAAEGERPPERDLREAKAKEICLGCPVRDACLDFAVAKPEKYGIYGGLNEDERARERERRMRRARAAA